MLHGRISESAVLDGLLTGARAGRSGALVIRGEAGIGKTALLERAAERAAGDLRVLRGAGVEQEMELPFAGLHLLTHGVLDGLDALPPGQAAALRGALGLDQAPAGGDRFLIGLAVLTLLANLAEERPLLVLIDDAQWLDRSSAQALLFAARRLEAEGVVLIFAVRDDGRPLDGDRSFAAPGVPELRLGGLTEPQAARLLAEHAPDLAPPVRDHVLAEAQGNPLALLELPATLSPAQRAGTLPVHAVGAGPMPAPGRVMRSFHARVAALPAGARALLAVAAADSGELELVLAAAHRLGPSGKPDTAPGKPDAAPGRPDTASREPDAAPGWPDAALEAVAVAEAAGLIRVTEGVIRFRHPLARTAAYQHASTAVRLAAHRALAEALRDRPGAATRRAWHLAAAATGPDETAAAALERGAEDARDRGGYAAVSAAYERAAQLTADRAERGRRLAAAARAAAECGQRRRAATLAEQAAAELDEPPALAHVAETRAMVAMAGGRTDRAHPALAAAAEALRGHASPAAALDLYFAAMTAAWLAGDYPALNAIAARTAALPGDARSLPLWRAVAGLGRLAVERPEDALPWLREVIEGVRTACESAYEPPGLQQRAQLAIWDLLHGDDDASHARAVAIEHECRALGAIGVLPGALLVKARAEMFLSRHRDAWASAEEGLRVAGDTGQPHFTNLLTGVMAYLSAIEGDEERVRALTHRIADARDPGTTGLRCASLNLADLAQGRYEAVLRRAREYGLDAPAAHTMMLLHRVPDIVEAAVKLGRTEAARVADRRVQIWAATTARPWAEAVGLRCTALRSEGAAADAAYARAVVLHGRGGRPFERARTELLYGEWLRRNRRRAESRPLLESALEIFERLGARPWIERARNELRAAGKRHQTGDLGERAAADVAALLTAQELQIVRMAADGMSNREIGARLFLSPRTVGYHLHKAFPKLNVASRGELARLPLAAHPDRPDRPQSPAG
ncbi:AAA family ATPase [Nonomuraea sp. NN258]|uniref:ATP-binding protein n=1 Tax=Nonomuraea antri TaxID=2730852 RepID=UPI00156963D7|nr:LuxR family transcriptional regulator [Nonomuraea antri]NRQ32395.1 AAA family ATPase [Nonomuraea antri]